MSEYKALNIKKQTPSACYFGMWPGMQDATDGRTQILDISGQGRHLSVGANDTYGAVTATSRYATITGAAAPTDKSLATAAPLLWNMLAGQSLLAVITVKAAAPGATAQVLNSRGAAGDVKGFRLFSETTGKPQYSVTDGLTSFTSGTPTNTMCDSTDHQMILGIDGTSKKGWGWIDGVLWSNMSSGETINAALVGTTIGDGPYRIGGAGDFVAASQGTWVNGANLQWRHHHLLVMPYWPANITAIVAELVRNPHRPLSDLLVPALASA